MKRYISVLSIMVMSGFIAFGQTPSPMGADAQFVTEAAEGGLAEVMIGQLVQTNSASQAVKDFGIMMVEEHTKINEELSALAQQKNYILPTSLTSSSQKDHDQLNKKTGADFDKAFMKQMIRDHEKIITLFRKQAQNGMDMDLKAWAASTLPALEQHLAHAREVQKGLKNESMNNNNGADNRKDDR